MPFVVCQVALRYVFKSFAKSKRRFRKRTDKKPSNLFGYFSSLRLRALLLPRYFLGCQNVCLSLCSKSHCDALLKPFATNKRRFRKRIGKKTSKLFGDSSSLRFCVLLLSRDFLGCQNVCLSLCSKSHCDAFLNHLLQAKKGSASALT